MNKCLFCYKDSDGAFYHKKCCKRFFGTETYPLIEIDSEKLKELAMVTVSNRTALTGVQPKLSLSLEAMDKHTKRLTIVGFNGDYILKPQSTDYPFMPEVEDLTMHLAKHFGINTAEHALIKDVNGQIAYLTKRFDRVKQTKIHVEDFCQLSELLTEQKYKSSYERGGKLIQKYATDYGLDTINYFRIILFSFLTGNNDMHLKNFSLVHLDQKIALAPAYDLLNVNLLFPKDKEELALTLNSKKNKLKKSDFEILASNLGISSVVVNNIFKLVRKKLSTADQLIDSSFLSESYKQRYAEILMQKARQIDLI